jgi:hypothetical protein
LCPGFTIDKEGVSNAIFPTYKIFNTLVDGGKNGFEIDPSTSLSRVASGAISRKLNRRLNAVSSNAMDRSAVFMVPMI